ncbi:MAG: hypothetical protein ACJ79K_03380 [Gemmatimonadaceae bacterium]
MTRRTRIVWTTVAAVFTAVNFAGAVFAGVAREPNHAGVHVLLGFIGLFLTWRLSPWRIVDRTLPPGYAASAELPADQMNRLSQIEQSVDAVAIEVERIGESQRFMTKVLTERDKPQPPGSAASPSAEQPPGTPPTPRRPQ